jgi:ribosomal protein S18 acetylase RimI-like enzyme
MPSVVVAEPKDADEVVRLLTGFRDHLGYDYPGHDAFERNVKRLLRDENTEYLLAAADGEDKPSAVCQLRFRHGIWRDGGDCLVEDLFVESSARGAGLGRALIEKARVRALAHDCTRMELDVNEENDAALALYRSFGFSDRANPGAPRDLYMRLHLD